MDETASQPVAVAQPETAQAVPPVRPARAGVDLAARPAPEWLDRVEGEISDVDLVLKCLARDSAKICQTCHAAQAAGELAARPMLARCASSKQPR